MFSKGQKKEEAGLDRIDTVIGEKTVFEGTILSTGTTRIDGVLKGEIKSDGTLIVGETGQIHGKVTTKHVLIAGVIYGNIFVSEKTEITKTGTIKGDIVTKSLIIQEGASFKGNCTMEVKNKADEEREITDAYEKEGMAEEME